jgi:hypothetical protein
MEELSQRLVEVECVLNKMNEQNIKKIPQEFWEFLNKNKDINYNFKYDDSKSITENNLHIDTISLLTYINMNFLLDAEAKKEMISLLNEDEIIAEEQRRKQYNPDSIFKNRIDKHIEQTSENVNMIEYKESVFQKIISKLRNFLHITQK